MEGKIKKLQKKSATSKKSLVEKKKTNPKDIKTTVKDISVGKEVKKIVPTVMGIHVNEFMNLKMVLFLRFDGYFLFHFLKNNGAISTG